ncbi:MAG: TonB family protein [Rhodospirillales bacterium]|nr:TonB family protein [Rhodospirillales bacterium]
MQVLSFRHGSASLTAAALGASGLAHAAGLAAFVALYDPEPAAPVFRPVVIEIVAAAPAATAGEPSPSAVAEPRAAVPAGQTPDIQVDEALLPEPSGVPMAATDAVETASGPHEVVPASKPPTAPAGTSTAVPVENEPSIFEIGIAALPPAAGFIPPPRRKPPVPAEETAAVAPVAPAAGQLPEHIPPQTAISESAAALGTKQIQAPGPEAAPDPGGEQGSSETASLPQDGESLLAADYAHASLGNQPPRYPRRARRDGLEGRVVLSARVSAAGRIVGLEVVRSSGHEILDRAAVRAVNRWTVRPARQGSKPVPSEVRIPILFRLTER